MAATTLPAEKMSFKGSERDFYDPTLLFQGEALHRTETPETMLTDYPFRPAPDISVRCDNCNVFVPLMSLKEHRLFHHALSILKYTNNEPKNSDALLKRRNAVLRRIKSAATNEKPVQPEQIQAVNDAYEYLKSILDGKFEELRQVREDVNAQVGGVALNCSPDCIYSVGIAASANERWKSYMEDARTLQDCFGEDKHKCFFGLYDGYHGRFAAEIAASELHKLLLSEMIKFDPRTKNVLAGDLSGEPDISHYRFDRPDTSQSERVLLYDESVSIIQNIINVCESKYNELIKRMDSTPEGSVNNDGKNLTDTPRKKKKKEKSPFEKKMHKAFNKAYYLLDILLSYGKDENSKIRWSGCSSLTCVIQDMQDILDEEEKEETEEKGDQENDDSGASGVSGGFEPPKTVGTIHLANAGNTHAVLVRGNRAYGLTKDHTPNNKKEKNRVLKDGGTLSDSSKECRVNGVLMTTRGLGNHGDKKMKKCVLVEPYTTSIPIDQYAQFLILATRGVWEVFSENEAASLLLKLLPSNQIPPPSKISSTLKPLYEELNRDHSTIEPNSRRVSFSSINTSARVKSAGTERIKSGRQRSATLQSVVEGSGSEKSESHITGAKGHQGQRSDVESEGKRSKNSGKSEGKRFGLESLETEANDAETEAKGQRSGVSSAKTSEGRKSSMLEEFTAREINHSTPTGSKQDSNKSSKKSRIYVDADMQTEMGSHNGDIYSDDSGNEGDVDTYLENISFPGSVSRISMIDGPPSREQMQRNQAKLMAEHLTQAALLAGAKDNITVMVVLLPGSKM